MKRNTFLLTALILLSACSTAPNKAAVETLAQKSMTVPKEQLTYCRALPALPNKDMSPAELTEYLNAWVTVHEECASKFKVLSDSVLKFLE
jgi:hypothetical protein